MFNVLQTFTAIVQSRETIERESSTGKRQVLAVGKRKAFPKSGPEL